MSGANGNVLGWVIEWRNSFRFYSGVVVEIDKKSPEKITVYDYIENEEYNLNLKNEHIKMQKPFLQQFIKYKRKQYLQLNQSADDEAVHDYILVQLERIGEDNKVMGIEKRIEIKRESLGLQKIKTSKARESKSNPEVEESGDDVEDDTVDDDEEDDEEDEDEGSDVDDDAEEEEEEEEEEESSEEEDSEEESSDEDDDEEEADSGKKVDMKVHILPYQDIRGFSVHVNSEGLQKILKSIKKDYKRHSNAIKGAQPKLFYRDPEGDIINIMTSQDLKYAYRTAKGSVSAKSGGLTAAPVVLKLFAELTTKPTPTVTPTTSARLTISTGAASLHATPRGSGGPLELNTSMDRNAVTQRRLKMSNSPLKPGVGASSYYQAHTTTAAYDDDDDEDVDGGGESEFKRYSQETFDLDSLAGSPERSPSDRVNSNTQTHSNAGSIAASSPKKPQKSQYEVIWKKGEILGSGSFGEVYSGINLVNGDRIAVKEVSFQGVNGKGKQNKNHMQQIKALQHEVKVLSSLDHPNIIKYLGTERTKYTLRIFLELATEGTVRDVINEFGPFPESLLRRYTIDIIEGLHFLHIKKFMHRDIKPTNLLISHGVVKLGDFGCSTTTRDDDLTGSNAGHGTIIGTAVYMAPEVMRIEDSVFGDSEADSPNSKRRTRDADDKSQAKSDAETQRRAIKGDDNDSPSPYSPGAGAEPKSSSSSKKGYNKKADSHWFYSYSKDLFRLSKD